MEYVSRSQYVLDPGECYELVLFADLNFAKDSLLVDYDRSIMDSLLRDKEALVG